MSSPKRKQPREVRYRAWWDGRGERALLRVLAPEKRAGLAFLSLPPNLWRWSPRDRETTRIPASERRSGWLGSDLSLDDATSIESPVAGQSHRVLRLDAFEDGRRAWVVESLASEPATARFARVLRWLELEHGTPLREERYAADGALLQTVERSDAQEVGGRWFPRLWVVRSREGEGRETRLRFREVSDAPELPDLLFTTTGLPPKT